MQDQRSTPDRSRSLIPYLVRFATASELRTAVFIIVTVGGGTGWAAMHDFALIPTIPAGWLALFGTVIATEAIHSMPTAAEVNDGS